eukprot:3103613-Rhodomonas_salina.1
MGREREERGRHLAEDEEAVAGGHGEVAQRCHRREIERRLPSPRAHTDTHTHTDTETERQRAKGRERERKRYAHVSAHTCTYDACKRTYVHV